MKSYSLPLLAGFCMSASAVFGLNLTFTNSTGLSDSDVYVWLQQDLTGTFANSGNAVTKNQSYSLSEITSQGLDISSWAGGRLFVSLGAPFPEQTTDGTAPQFVNPPGSVPELTTSPGAPTPINNSFNNRHQLVTEITTGGSANLSNIDWVTVPARLTTLTGGVQQEAIGFKSSWTATDSANYGNSLSALTNGFANINAISNAAGNSPTSYTQTGTPTVQPASPGSGQPVRILGPTQQTFFNTTQASQQYTSFTGYVDQIRADHPSPSSSQPVASLKGKYFAGDTPVYDAQVTGFAAPADPATSLGSVVIEGTLVGSSTENFVITIDESNFTNDNVYSASSSLEFEVSVDGAPATTQNLGTNNAYTLPVRDLIAGLNYGYINSSTPNPNDSGNTYGESESQYWGSLNLITLTPQTLMAFDEVNTFYNEYAGIVHSFSDGQVYGFAYDDVFSVNQVNLNVDELNIELFPSIYSVPEPQTYALIVGLAGLALAIGMRSKHARK